MPANNTLAQGSDEATGKTALPRQLYLGLIESIQS